jgi:hypothetical protein
MEFKIKKDWEWYLAEVEWNDSIFAYWKTEEEAKTEFVGVLDMMIDYHSELVTNEKALRNLVLNNKDFNYAL